VDDITGRELRLSGQVYRLRVLGLAVRSISVAAVLYERPAG